MYPFKDITAQRRALIDETLKSLIQLEGFDEDRLPEAMNYAILGGGKRVRPLLVMGAADLFDLSPEHSVRAGCAIEMLHAYSLAHDDLPAMDDSDLRRGRASVHKQFDEATSILAGDALQAFVFEVMADQRTHPEAQVRVDLCLSMAKAAGYQGMAGGQMLDLMAETMPALDLPTTRRLQARKTGAIIAFSLEAGATLGGASADQKAALAIYADNLGLTFQITDDLLDVESDAATLGKPIGQDAEAGKVTFISHYGIEGARAEAKRLTDEAKAALGDERLFDATKTAYLLHMADYVLNRSH